MHLDRARVVARREYLTRVRSKAFWIATVALPLFVAAIALLPTLLITRTAGEHRVAVVDETGRIGTALVERLAESGGALNDRRRFRVELESAGAQAEAQRADLDRRVLAGEIDAWIWIRQRDLDEDRVEYHAASVSNFLTQTLLESRLSAVVRAYRLEQAGYDAEEIARLGRSIDLDTVRVSAEGSHTESATAGIALAYVLFFLLYMVLVVYGQQVMTGVLEEKSTRIVEVVVSTSGPLELMAGKLAGICLVALTQLGIWLVTLATLTLPGVVGAMAWIPQGVDVPTLEPLLLLHFLLLFLLGFLVYSTFYASIGAAFNNVQEAQQFAAFAVAFLIAPVFFFWMVLNDPDSTVAVVTSLVPVFTPLLMMLRIAVKTPPLWQVLLGYLLTTLFALGMVWVSSRIYRVGILLYGKKPTLKELWRWVRYA